MSEVVSDTKMKIIESARVLFADLGFEGTSIREIAKAAGVNIAAVNYHFSSKEKLFTEILQAGYAQCSAELRKMYEQEGPCLEDFLVHLFRYFTTRSHDLISYFKMIMSAQHNHHMMAQGTDDEFFGPPGGKVIAEAIQKEAGINISEEDLHWGLRSLFNHVVHTSILYHCCYKNNSIPFTDNASLEKNIRRLTRAVLSDLKRT